MKKLVIILEGESFAKTTFIETVKQEQFWVWNISSKNVLSFVAHKLLWNGTKDKNYFDFIKSLEKLADTHFSFTKNYFYGMITKFKEIDTVNMLIFHNAPDNLAKELRENQENCYIIYVGGQNKGENKEYDLKIDSFDENYKTNILCSINSLFDKN